MSHPDDTSDPTHGLEDQIASADQALTAQIDQDLEHISNMIENLFQEFNKHLMKPVEEQVSYRASLTDLMRLKDFTPWFGHEKMDAELDTCSIVTGYRYSADACRRAKLAASQILVGLIHARVQTYVESIEFRFYPRHEFQKEDGSPDPWPAIEMELTLATIVNVKPPSLLESVGEADEDGLEVEEEAADIAGTGDDDTQGEDR